MHIHDIDKNIFIKRNTDFPYILHPIKDISLDVSKSCSSKIFSHKIVLKPNIIKANIDVKGIPITKTTCEEPGQPP